MLLDVRAALEFCCRPVEVCEKGRRFLSAAVGRKCQGHRPKSGAEVPQQRHETVCLQRMSLGNGLVRGVLFATFNAMGHESLPNPASLETRTLIQTLTRAHAQLVQCIRYYA